jgi:DNA-3-methyladenine glycosylase II
MGVTEPELAYGIWARSTGREVVDQDEPARREEPEHPRTLLLGALLPAPSLEEDEVEGRVGGQDLVPVAVNDPHARLVLQQARRCFGPLGVGLDGDEDGARCERVGDPGGAGAGPGADLRDAEPAGREGAEQAPDLGKRRALEPELPRELERVAEERRLVHRENDDLSVLRVPDPYDFELSTERFQAFGPDRANLWHAGGLHRVVGGREVRVEPARGGVLVEPFDDGIRAVVEKLLGLEFDLDMFAQFAAGDSVLATIVPRLAGFRPPLSPDPFEALVSSITAQQVSLFAAFAIRNRLIERFGEPGEQAFGFPTRERLARAHEAELVALGFSRRKAEYVLVVARADLDLDGLAALPDEDVKERLTALRGLGDWSADWFLARHLARPEAWPAGDLGLRKAVSAFYGGGRSMTTQEVREIGARFAPFQNLTAHHLLTGLRVLPR